VCNSSLQRRVNSYIIESIRFMDSENTMNEMTISVKAGELLRPVDIKGNSNKLLEYLDVNASLFVETYSDFNELAPIRQEWDNFVESLGGEIFLTFDWCRVWWKYYGHKRDLMIFIFRNGGEICGILPLFLEKIWIGPVSIAVIKMVSSDFMPVTITVPIKNRYIDQVVDILITGINARWRWHLLHLGAICGRYDSLDTLINAFKSKLGCKYRCELNESDVQTYFTVANDWEAQIASLASKQRTNVRRTFRETSTKGIEISSHLASKDTLLQMFDNFVQMHQKHWRGIGNAGHFGAWPFSKEFHREIAEIQFALNRLRLIEIKFNNIPVGYEYLYRLQDTYCWFLNARSDFEDNARIDYKWIAYRAKIGCALNDGVKTIDGMRGMYDYKLLMGGKVLPIHNLLIYSTQFPVMQRIFVFRLLSKVLDILYHKIWRRRLAPRSKIKLHTFWRKWILFGPLSS
jgi:hypothetical protein